MARRTGPVGRSHGSQPTFEVLKIKYMYIEVRKMTTKRVKCATGLLLIRFLINYVTPRAGMRSPMCVRVWSPCVNSGGCTSATQDLSGALIFMCRVAGYVSCYLRSNCVVVHTDDTNLIDLVLGKLFRVRCEIDFFDTDVLIDFTNFEIASLIKRVLLSIYEIHYVNWSDLLSGNGGGLTGTDRYDYRGSVSLSSDINKI